MAAILVIEDEEAIRRQLEHILRGAGHDVRTAPNGAVGLESALSNPPDLVLCDLMMPQLDGHGVLRGLRENGITENLPLIFLTARTSPEDVRNAMNSGADDCLPKPFRVRDVMDAVAARLRRSQSANKASRPPEPVSAEMLHAGGVDYATGLPNRMGIRQMLDSLQANVGPDAFFGVMVVGLPRFYDAVDAVGIPEEEVQRANARWLVERVGNAGSVAVLQPDRFVIVTGPHAGGFEAEKLAHTFFPQSRIELRANGHKLVQPVAVGVAVHPDDGQRVDELIRRATRAVLSASSAPGVRRVISADNSAHFHNPMAMETAMRRGLQANNFHLHFQPQFDIASGELSGAEALLRWTRPDGKIISPAQFIPIAEETGFILELGRWVLNAAVQQVESWHNQGLNPSHVSVNVSALQLADASFIDHVDTLSRASSLEPGKLVLELTETVVARDLAHAAQTLHAARRTGAHVSLDDFGTGYSSLGYLSQLPLNHLKLDRILVQDLHVHATKRTIVSGVLDMAHRMGLVVVAEGVECQPEMDALKALGCDRVQGFHTGRPMPADQFAALCRTHQRND